ncbi:sugar phosphate isomerase/epimerase family protein [Cohnella sp. 56]|uniref:sugar phosphate isomerase/epimerase family protein n=1 Tax=Cohnella sp. 56 TaxID=3113722 RepID=UPI0030E93EF2
MTIPSAPTGADKPKLYLEQSWWAMSGLGTGEREWTLEEKFAKIAEAGYDGICGFIPGETDTRAWRRLLDEYRLGFSGLAFPSSVMDLKRTMAEAKRFGNVNYLNAQVMDAFVAGDDAVRLLRELLDTAEEAGIALRIETHRGTVTQDLLRTVSYVEAIPALPLTIDLSHYVVAGEMNGTGEAAEACFDRLLAHTAGIHARVSDGEKVQVDIGSDGAHPMLPHFRRWWGKGMREWRRRAAPGAVLPFVTELGPPGYYAITRRLPDGSDAEISNRWEQALLFKRIAERLWAEIDAEG